MRSTWTRWLPVVAMLGVAGCSSGKPWSMASLWPWGKSDSSAAQTKLAQNPPGKPPLASANVRPQTLNGQTQLAANTAAPGWSGVTPAGGTGAWPLSSAAPAAGAASTTPGWPPAGAYGAPAGYATPAADPNAAAAYTAQNYGTPGYGTPGYGTPGYGSQGLGQPAPSYGAAAQPGFGAPAGYGTPGFGTPGYSAAPAAQTGVTAGFDNQGGPWPPQAQVNPYAQSPAAAPGYGGGAAAATPAYGSGAGYSGAGYGNTSPFPATQPGAAGAAESGTLEQPPVAVACPRLTQFPVVT